MNSYELSRNFFDWCYENTSKVRPIHAALYFFAIEHNNRLGWKKEFGLPRQMAMDAIGVKNNRTFTSAFNDLEEWKFFKVVERSKNQYSANVISLNAYVKNTPATTKALSKAMQKHSQKQVLGIAPINKPINQLTNKPENRETALDFLKSEREIEYSDFEMQNKKMVDDWEHLIEQFNDTAVIEINQGKIKWDSTEIMARFRKFVRSWISNQKPPNFQSNSNSIQSTQRLSKLI